MTKHGESKTFFYRKWWHIRARCTFKWDKDYHRYGAKGINFEWPDYLDFKKDMYRSYVKHVKKFGKKNTTIDRIDNTKGYSKTNCRWATFNQQALNKTTSKFLTINGIRRNYSEWAKSIGCSRQALRYRVISGLKTDLILSLPFKHSNKYAVRPPNKNN